MEFDFYFTSYFFMLYSVDMDALIYFGYYFFKHSILYFAQNKNTRNHAVCGITTKIEITITNKLKDSNMSTRL